MSAIVEQQKTTREQVIFWFSVLLFGVLNLIPGLTRSYADAQYGGGGGGECPGATCVGQFQPLCCQKSQWVCNGPNGGPPCGQVTHYYYYPGT